MRKLTKSKLKKKAWKLFSEFIRRRDADNDGYNTCVTCSVKKPWKELHASHLVPGRRDSILFDERGVFPACYVCNIHKHGNILEYQEYLRDIHGREKADDLIAELRRLSKQVLKRSTSDYEALIELYKEKLKGLK